MHKRVVSWGLAVQEKYPQLHTRTWRAANMYAKGNRPQVENGLYRVKSASRDVAYEVDFNNGTCSCIDWKKGLYGRGAPMVSGRPRCKHWLFVFLWRWLQQAT